MASWRNFAVNYRETKGPMGLRGPARCHLATKPSSLVLCGHPGDPTVVKSPDVRILSRPPEFETVGLVEERCGRLLRNKRPHGPQGPWLRSHGHQAELPGPLWSSSSPVGRYNPPPPLLPSTHKFKLLDPRNNFLTYYSRDFFGYLPCTFPCLGQWKKDIGISFVGT